MSKLISGKEALIALVNGDCVMCRNESSGRITDAKYQSVENILHGGYEYRGEFIGLEFFIKPKTILLNGVEIPAPFKPKVGDTYWYLTPNYENGYDYLQNSTGKYDSRLTQFGVWDSEDKIKEVVKAVRNVFNCGDKP